MPSTHEEESTVAPHKSTKKGGRLLHGLSLGNIITHDEDHDAVDAPHVTRQTIHGRPCALYDQSFHPIDAVLKRRKVRSRRRGSPKESEDQTSEDSSAAEVEEAHSDISDPQPAKPRPTGCRQSQRIANTHQKKPLYDRNKHPADEELDLLSDREHRAANRKRKRSQRRGNQDDAQHADPKPSDKGLNLKNDREIVISSASSSSSPEPDMLYSSKPTQKRFPSDMSLVLSDITQDFGQVNKPYPASNIARHEDTRTAAESLLNAVRGYGDEPLLENESLLEDGRLDESHGESELPGSRTGNERRNEDIEPKTTAEDPASNFNNDEQLDVLSQYTDSSARHGTKRRALREITNQSFTQDRNTQYSRRSSNKTVLRDTLSDPLPAFTAINASEETCNLSNAQKFLKTTTTELDEGYARIQTEFSWKHA